jgi:hypothetical protein
MSKEKINRKEKKDKVISIRVSNEVYSILEQIALQTKDMYIESKKPVNAVVEDLIFQRIYPLLVRNSVEIKIKFDKETLEFIKGCVIHHDLTHLYIINEIESGITALKSYKEKYVKMKKIIDKAIKEYEDIFNIDFARLHTVQNEETNQ